jgi:predicted transcriptional regulator/transcriptional regulator with XRE-family HTH domain
MRTRKQKLFMGNKIRRFRQQHQLTQAALANQLGISASYLNQIESDQRPLTAAILVKLGSLYPLDLSQFSDEEDERISGELTDCLADPLFANQRCDPADIRDLASRSPALARHFVTLYQAYLQSRDNYTALAMNVTGDSAVHTMAGAQFPYEEVRDFFYYQRNYFDALDRAAELLYHALQLNPDNTEALLIQHLSASHGIRIQHNPNEERLREYSPAKHTLLLSRLLSRKQRVFHLAHQICLLEQRELLNHIVASASFNSHQANAVCRVGLANYFAGALLMPYREFLDAARLERYDIERLQVIFNVSFEQICHRFSTLQRPGEQGIPFYFLRVDAAGNISKRQSASSFHFARVGGACPLWNVHEAFAQPGKILRQIAQLPDGKTYFCIARTVSRSEGGFLMPQKNFAVALGCELDYAHQLVYSVGLDLHNPKAAVPIGISCRICERKHCPQRAFPPIGKPIEVDENAREFLPYRIHS